MAMTVQVAGLWLPNSSSTTPNIHFNFLHCHGSKSKPPSSSSSALSATASLSSPAPTIQVTITALFKFTKGFAFRALCGIYREISSGFCLFWIDMSKKISFFVDCWWEKSDLVWKWKCQFQWFGNRGWLVWPGYWSLSLDQGTASCSGTLNWIFKNRWSYIVPMQCQYAYLVCA